MAISSFSIGLIISRYASDEQKVILRIYDVSRQDDIENMRNLFHTAERLFI